MLVCAVLVSVTYQIHHTEHLTGSTGRTARIGRPSGFGFEQSPVWPLSRNLQRQQMADCCPLFPGTHQTANPNNFRCSCQSRGNGSC